MKNGPNDLCVYVDQKVADVAKDVIEHQAMDDAFYICDLRDIEYKARMWSQELPRVTPYFAVKACTDAVVLWTLNSLGFNYDCSNKVEMNMVFDMGVSPDRIVYANTVKCSSHLRFALEHGVNLITFDSVEELEKFKNKDVRLLMRMAANEYGSMQNMNKKYGTQFDDARKLLELAKFMGLEVVGLSFHVGCAYKHPQIWANTIAECRAVFDIAEGIGFTMTILDIGGGFPGGVRKMKRFQEVCFTIRTELERHFPESSGVEIIGEPGQFFVTSAYTLATKVVGKRRRDVVVDGVSVRHEHVYINESKYNCIPRDLYQYLDITYRPIKPPYDRPADVLTTIWGATCNPNDFILENTRLFEVDVDEWLLMDNMGAYSLVLACGFNGFSLPPVKYIASPARAAALEKVFRTWPMRPGYGHFVPLMRQQPVKECLREDYSEESCRTNGALKSLQR
ncbi:ornithine decarboxylase-like isoform X2 [Ornithodoros turicata]